ncbi:unnamed protein product [Arabis nemorensis]|uniref:DUF7610 domain-containing protein n=1 Tax=Arabis nemorensis TaxID=586526 RepID=A0A565BT92_9BRAS|nr:unnamed protein product [Arabis nemorensis]
MKRKAKINSVLEKKLEELESLREAITFNDINPNLYNEIKHAVLFAKTLLMAEILSRPTDMEREEDSEETLELAYMAKRLTELEEAFKTNQLSGHDNCLVIEPETGSLETNDGDVNGETGSVYSWVESCKKEFDKPEGEEDAEQRPLFVDASSEEKREVTFPAVAAVMEEVVVREVNEKRRGNKKDDNFFLTPT